MVAAEAIGVQELRAVISTFTALLRAHREVINRLNVYPVPDGDTGTNMTLTMESVEHELAGLDSSASLHDLGVALAHGSLMGARGNSGVILSQMMRGFASVINGSKTLTPDQVVTGLREADHSARQAVVRVVEGTMLSVARGAAERAGLGGDLVAVLRQARDGAEEALARTPEQLPVLAQAGVVDSGGTGLTLLFHALCHVVAGDELPTPPALETVHVHVMERPSSHGDVSDLRYEVMFLLSAPDEAMAAFRSRWASLGDSIVIVGGDGLHNCHIHTDDVGGAIEAALDIGRPRDIRVTDLADQVVEERWVREHVSEADDSATPPPTTAVVAVVAGDGLARLFRSLGVRRVVSGGQTMNPSTADVRRAVEATGSSSVVVLPNNKNIRAVAEQVDAVADEAVAVVPTDSVIEGLAAMVAYQPGADLEVNQRAMSQAASQVVTGEVTQAVRDATTAAGPVVTGDWLGLSKDGVVTIAESIAVAARGVLEHIVKPTHELVTIIEGEGASPANTRRITDFLAEVYPDIEVDVHHGGQPLYPYLLGAE